MSINTAKNYLINMKYHRMPGCIEISKAKQQVFNKNEYFRDINTLESMLATKQIIPTVSIIMESLPEELRMTITLREIEELSYDKIADIMYCLIGTVRNRIELLRKKFVFCWILRFLNVNKNKICLSYEM